MYTRRGWDCFVQRRNPVGQNARNETQETKRLYEEESNDRFGKMCGEFECFLVFSFIQLPTHHFLCVCIYLLTDNLIITQAPFTRVRANFCTYKNLYGSTLSLHEIGGTGQTFEQLSVQVWDLLFFRSRTCILSRSNIRPGPQVPGKRKVEQCKFLFVQKFVRRRVNGA